MLHGRPLTYVLAGSGPVLLLIHGIAGSLENWQAVIEPLARGNTVVAPDLPGHGGSAPGGGDYSLGALAAALRDLLVALGHERATLVGHSLGGGVAMQFAYQFPELTERLVLVSSGGLGPEVSVILRAAALPGANRFIAATAALGNTVGTKVARGLGAVGLRPSADVAEVARGYASLVDRDRRAAFLAHAPWRRRHWRPARPRRRPVLPCRGHSRPDRSGGAHAIRIIPAQHGQNAHEAIVGSRLEIFEGVGHLPQLEAPGLFIAALERFIAETEPARIDPEHWRGRLCIASGQRTCRGPTPQ